MKIFVITALLFSFQLFSQSQDTLRHFESVSDRWGIDTQEQRWNPKSNWFDPYNQNKLKGDRPVIGEDVFLILSAASNSELDAARLPTPSGVSTNQANKTDFFGAGERALARQNFNMRLEFYRGQTAFRPRDWEVRINANLNLSYLATRENNNVNINPVASYDRFDQRYIALQEAFIEKRILDLSNRFDFVSGRIGIQGFVSDFRGFVFADNQLALRIFGNYANNHWQYNFVGVRQIEKDTNSGLNSFTDRYQRLFIGNVYRQDWLVTGYTSQVSLHYNYDIPSTYFDDNGFPVRPALIGANRTHRINAWYIGTTGEGHWGRFNLTHAFYQALGTDSFNQLAGRAININAQMAALELSYDIDWKRYRVAAFYASGDRNPSDGSGNGFDAIVDSPLFAGGSFSFWNTQAIRLMGVNLVNANSLLPNLRPSKFEGQSNFFNPGIFIANAGFEAEVTPKIRAFTNANYLQFVTTAALQKFLNQATIRNEIGIDAGLGVEYRPFLNNQAAIRLAGTALFPMRGFVDIYQSRQVLFATQLRLVLAY